MREESIVSLLEDIFFFAMCVSWIKCKIIVEDFLGENISRNGKARKHFMEMKRIENYWKILWSFWVFDLKFLEEVLRLIFVQKFAFFWEVGFEKGFGSCMQQAKLFFNRQILQATRIQVVSYLLSLLSFEKIAYIKN